MKLILQTTDKVEVEHIKARLESVGIPLFVGNEDSARNFGLVMPARLISCWVPLEEQYEDAVKYLDDENHLVTTGIDIRDYYDNLESFKKDSSKKTFDWIMSAIVLSGLVGLAFYVYSKLSHA